MDFNDDFHEELFEEIRKETELEVAKQLKEAEAAAVEEANRKIVEAAEEAERLRKEELRGFTGRDGKDGKDGERGRDGRDGKDGPAGPMGPTGPQGLKGDRGRDGLDGEDGDGIEKAYVNDNYHLTIKLNSGKVIDAGYVRGQAGVNGTKGGRVTGGYSGGGGNSFPLAITQENAGKFITNDGTSLFWDTFDEHGSHNIDGGHARSVYLVSQNTDGGSASG